MVKDKEDKVGIMGCSRAAQTGAFESALRGSFPLTPVKEITKALLFCYYDAYWSR